MMRVSWLVLLGALGAFGCSDESDDGDGGADIQALAQGTWASGCVEDAGTSSEGTLTIAGTSLVNSVVFYDTADCSGAGTEHDDTGTLSFGAGQQAALASSQVTAFPVNVAFGDGTTMYDLIYVDTAATPDRLYLGDSSGALDGSTAALRPVAIDGGYWLEKQ